MDMGGTGYADEEERIISLAEAAKMIGTSYPTVVRLATSGELKAFRIRHSWRTSTTVCKEYIREQFEKQAQICRSRETTEEG